VGLRDEAEKLLSDQRSARCGSRGCQEPPGGGACQRAHRYSEVVSGRFGCGRPGVVHSASMVSFSGGGGVPLKDIAFSGSVMAYNGADAGLADVRVKTGGMFRGPVITNKQTLAEALEFHARH